MSDVSRQISDPKCRTTAVALGSVFRRVPTLQPLRPRCIAPALPFAVPTILAIHSPLLLGQPPLSRLHLLRPCPAYCRQSCISPLLFLLLLPLQLLPSLAATATTICHFSAESTTLNALLYAPHCTSYTPYSTHVHCTQWVRIRVLREDRRRRGRPGCHARLRGGRAPDSSGEGAHEEWIPEDPRSV